MTFDNFFLMNLILISIILITNLSKQRFHRSHLIIFIERFPHFFHFIYQIQIEYGRNRASNC